MTVKSGPQEYNIYECNRCKFFRATTPEPIELYCKHYKHVLGGEVGTLMSPPPHCEAMEKGRPEYIKREKHAW